MVSPALYNSINTKDLHTEEKEQATTDSTREEDYVHNTKDFPGLGGEPPGNARVETVNTVEPVL